MVAIAGGVQPAMNSVPDRLFSFSNDYESENRAISSMFNNDYET